jgi:hypothetical protein
MELMKLREWKSKEMQPEGNFYSLGFNEEEIGGLLTAYSYISANKCWEILARRDVPGDSGFVTPKHLDFHVIHFISLMKQLNIPSFGFVMRQMEFIAKNGWVKFVIERRDIVIPRNRLKAGLQV